MWVEIVTSRGIISNIVSKTARKEEKIEKLTLFVLSPSFRLIYLTFSCNYVRLKAGIVAKLSETFTRDSLEYTNIINDKVWGNSMLISD